ncbi:MAG: EscE/YscE/SsaE family type III secretion system needle protein co-chaperone [Parvibaculaceae bacterium]|nr:EscE/YscE/SsaE family type III secretion system needle protein co-chaperone [Parvibaculaceae bacterium]
MLDDTPIHLTELERKLWNDEAGDVRREILGILSAAEDNFQSQLQGNPVPDDRTYILKLLNACKAARQIILSYRRSPATFFES